jgi:hypothetical protein
MFKQQQKHNLKHNPNIKILFLSQLFYENKNNFVFNLLSNMFQKKNNGLTENHRCQTKKNAKLILHIILELANKFGLAINKNTLKEMTFSKAIKILQSILKKIQHTAGHLSQLKHVNIDKVT